MKKSETVSAVKKSSPKRKTNKIPDKLFNSEPLVLFNLPRPERQFLEGCEK